MADYGNKFDNSKSNMFGDLGEELFEKAMTSHGHIVENMSKDHECRLADTDFFVTNKKSGKRYGVEVKWDDRINKTGNMFVETLASGWLQTTKADFIAYGDAKSEIFYMFKTDMLRLYIRTHINSLRKITYPTVGRLVNMTSFLNWCNDEADIRNDVTGSKINLMIEHNEDDTFNFVRR